MQYTSEDEKEKKWVEICNEVKNAREKNILRKKNPKERNKEKTTQKK